MLVKGTKNFHEGLILSLYVLAMQMFTTPYITIFSKDDEEALSSETPIYWDFNGLHQEDPKLIQFIKETVLIPPPRLLQRGTS